MAKVPRRSWGSYSRAWRNKMAARAAEEEGLTRRQARERFNRGTYHPNRNKPSDRISDFRRRGARFQIRDFERGKIPKKFLKYWTVKDGKPYNTLWYGDLRFIF